MSSPLAQSIADLSSADELKRIAAASEIYRLGRATGGSAIAEWWAESELSALLHGPTPSITVGLAVPRDTFGRIRVANGTPRLAQVPPDQDAEEFAYEGIAQKRSGAVAELQRLAGLSMQHSLELFESALGSLQKLAETHTVLA